MKLEDLIKMKETPHGDLEIDEGSARYKIIVGMGTCGIAAGAREVVSALVSELSERGIEDVIVTQAGCKGMCENEPIVDVEDEDGIMITYGNINAERARTIIGEHIVGGVIVKTHVIVS